MKKLQKKFQAGLTLVLAASLFLGSMQPVFATSSAQSKKTQAEKNLNNVNSKINNLESQKADLQNKIDSANAELVQLLVDVDILEDEIKENQKQLEEVTTKLKKAKKDEDKQYKSMKKRIKFMYENGDSEMISSILESKSMADLLNRVEYINQVYGYDRDLLVTYQKTRLHVQDLKQQTEDERAELETSKDDLKQQQTNLQAKMDDMKSKQSDADAQIANAKSLASQYKDTITAQNKIIQASASTSSGSSSGGSSGGGSAPSGNLNPSYNTSVSGSDVVSYALQFVGNPYVWGGKDPNTGADCSGFTSYVYAHFGINIPSYSESQRGCGQEVSYSNAKAGDLICYAGHVAIYMGNGQIVHAKGRAYGIVAYDNATYKNIITVRRLL